MNDNARDAGEMLRKDVWSATGLAIDVEVKRMTEENVFVGDIRQHGRASAANSDAVPSMSS